MSIQGSAGAESAAAEILAFVRKKILHHIGNPDILSVLREIETDVERIKKDAEEGW